MVVVSVYPLWEIDNYSRRSGRWKTTLVLNLAAKLSKGIGLDEDMQVSEPMNIFIRLPRMD